jgi:predicted dehydrogenase
MKSKKIRFGILGYADIAKRKFIPALLKSKAAVLHGIASRSNRKAVKYAKQYETNPHSYQSLLDSPDIDAVYIPLPNFMHFDWALKALFAGKHVLCEKPAVLSEKDADLLIEAAVENNKTIMEGFMFLYHPQHSMVREAIKKNDIGEVRLFRSSFGFTLRDPKNFRLINEPGCGCLYDLAGYPIAMMRFLFNQIPKECRGYLEVNKDNVDVSYEAVLSFENDLKALISGGFRQQYECFYEIIGTKGKICLDRAYTTPADMTNNFTITCGCNAQTVSMRPSDHFTDMIDYFAKNLNDPKARRQMLEDLIMQSRGMDILRKGLEKIKV